MTTFTLSQRIFSAWVSWRSFLPVLFILSSLALPTTVLAQAQSDNAIYLQQQPTGASSQQAYYAGKNLDSPYDSYTNLGNPNSSPVVPTPALGTYDLNKKSTLTIVGGAIVAPSSRGTTVTNATMLYRAYLSGTSTAQLPAPSQLDLPLVGKNSFGDNIYQTNSAAIDLLSGLTNGGNYIVDVQFQLTVRNDKDNSVTTSVDPNGSYNLAFYITPPPTTPPGGTTTWQGTSRGPNNTTLTSDTDWTNPANWSNGVPSATANAIIPPKTTSGIVYPILNDINYNYAVNNLTLQGNSGSTSAQLVINVATLSVYGNLSQPGGGLAGNVTNLAGVADNTKNSTIIFAGGNQIISGQLLVSDIIIAGSGVKSVINTMIPSNIIAFRPADATAGTIVQSAAQDINSGVVTTLFDTTGNYFISLVSSSSISLVPGESETTTSYIKGVTRADRNLRANESNKFGNIGLELTANHSPGNLFVYRVVGDPLSGPVSTNAKPVKRYFKILGDDDSRSAATAGSTIDVVFHYLNSSDGTTDNYNELNSISESNLAMFRSEVNGAPYTAVGGTLRTDNKTVTRVTLPSLNTSFITLGDKTNPLPVSLTAFTATRSNTNAVLAWTTASELGNTGFEVQVSSDGSIFRKLAFVASQNPNSNQTLNYTYTDAENGKAGVRYYRLRQIDLSGEEAFSPVRAVNFGGVALASTVLSAYPNPFADKLDFNLDATTVGNGAARVQLVDMTGRLVKEQNLSVNNASLSLSNLADLRSGFYIAKITLANGTTQAVRIQKQ